MLKNRNKFIPFLSFIIIFSCKKTEYSDVKSKVDTIEMMKDSAVNEHKARQEKNILTYSNYKGAWFNIEYPASFKVENSLKSSTSSEGFDSAFFTSPDGKVQFYIFRRSGAGNLGILKFSKTKRYLKRRRKSKTVFS